jgi:hypothetical protein
MNGKMKKVNGSDNEYITTFTTNKNIKEETPTEIGAFEGPKGVLKMYHIYHCINKHYMFTETEKQPRKYVGFVLADSLDQAFKLSQNDFNPDYAKYGARSTSVGDLIQDFYGFYMVCNTGFRLICLVDEESHE